MRRKYKPTPSVKFGDRPFYGETLALAKQNMKAAAEAAFRGNYDPRLLLYRNVLVVIWRELDSWLYRIQPLTPDPGHPSLLEEGKVTQFHSFAAPRGDDLPTAIKSAAMHLAHWTWSRENDPEGFVPPFLTDPEEQREFLFHCKWQRDYRRYKLMGYSDNDCHKLACGWPAEDQPVVPVETAV